MDTSVESIGIILALIALWVISLMMVYQYGKTCGKEELARILKKRR